MAKVYRIHPGIGIARVGNSPDDAFIAAETLGGEPADLNGGATAPFSGYKDATGQLKRQGARFRIFEYESDAGGERLVGEITAPQAEIEWTVTLANTKAAGNEIVGARVLYPDGPPRNTDADRGALAITPVLPPISGRSQVQREASPGHFRGRAVELGELRTDDEGRLIVLGGHGVAASHPNPSPIGNFANNEHWFDDVSDGPVDAKLTFPGEAPIQVQHGSWVIVAPPDFAPPVEGLATLYDVALSAHSEASWPPPQPSYQRDILPILQRVANLRWVQKYAFWNSFSKDYALLGTKSPAGDAARTVTYNKLIDVETSGLLTDFNYTRLQKKQLEDWKNGQFTDDYDPDPPAEAFGPQALDRGVLAPCVGGGWYPGIEAGVILTNPEVYSEPCRLTRQAFQDRGAALTLRAGSLTERMACPWQADFYKCAGTWWPAQRPDKVFLGLPPAHTAQGWEVGINDHEDLVANFWKLGIVTPAGEDATGQRAFFETERDAGLPRSP